MNCVISWKKKVQNVSEFKNFNFRKTSYEICYYVKRHFLPFSCTFEKQDLMFRISQCVRFRKKNYTRCEILNQTLENVAEIEKNLHSKGCFINHVTTRKRHLFAFSLLFQNAWIKKSFFLCIKVLCRNLKKSLLSKNHVLNYVS